MDSAASTHKQNLHAFKLFDLHELILTNNVLNNLKCVSFFFCFMLYCTFSGFVCERGRNRKTESKKEIERSLDGCKKGFGFGMDTHKDVTGHNVDIVRTVMLEKN